MLAVLLPVPVDCADTGDLLLLAGTETVTDWLRVESRLMVTPVSTPSDASNWSSSLVPKLALLSLALPPFSLSVTKSLSLNDTSDVS